MTFGLNSELQVKKLPIGIQSIDKILGTDDYVYVDKTAHIKRLIDSGASHYFLSRPRRFGKSLFVSTLEEIFKGNKHLFKECAIYNSDYDWQSYPVLHFDFSLIANQNPEALEAGLYDALDDISARYNLSISGSSLQSRLTRLVRAIAEKGQQVVVLVDEYDKPIISHLPSLNIAKKNRDLLADFFGALKGLDTHIRFTFITGVSKFSQVSIFSGLNNLKDITMIDQYADMLGYTEEELLKHFQPHIDSILQKRNASGQKLARKEIIDEIRAWYNGYRFSKDSISVYNPFSTLNFMESGFAEGYWYSTGTPSFLIDEVKKHPQTVTSLSGSMALKSSLMNISRLDRINLTALMFQTGYLTVSNYLSDQDVYCLDFPNREVREAFFNSLLEDFAQVTPTDVSQHAMKIQKSLQMFEINNFIEIINGHFAKISYQLFVKAQEGFFSAIFLTFLERSGIKTNAEISTNIGRVDLVAELPEHTCVFEFKLDQSADIAFNQADAKNYKERYSHAEKNTLVIGINFSSKSRNISEWKAKLFSPDGQELKEL